MISIQIETDSQATVTPALTKVSDIMDAIPVVSGPGGTDVAITQPVTTTVNDGNGGTTDVTATITISVSPS